MGIGSKNREFLKCFRDVVGTLPRTFGVIWTHFWHLPVQYSAHFGEFCEENTLWWHFEEAV